MLTCPADNFNLNQFYTGLYISIVTWTIPDKHSALCQVMSKSAVVK